MDNFDFLINFAEFFKSKKLVKDLPLSLDSPPRSKIERLFQGIVNGEFKSDREAAEKIYGTPPSNPAYIRLRERLNKKLIQQVFLIDFGHKTFSPQSKEYYNNFTLATASRIIMGLGNNFLAYPLIKKGIKKTKGHRFSEVGLLLSISFQLLQHDYSLSKEKKTKNSIYAIETPLLFLDTLRTEIEIEIHHGTITSNLLKGGLPIDSEIKKAYFELLKLSKNIENIAFLSIARLYYALSAANIHFRNYKQAIKNCDTGIHLLSNSTLPAVHILCLLKAQCFLHLNQFKRAEESIIEAEEKKNRVELNWVAVSEIKFLHLARSGSFNLLPALYEQTTTDPKFRIRPALTKESWRQYGLLLLFLIKLDKISPSESLNWVKSKLRLGKLMNEMPEYSKDKTGQNLAIRILFVLNLLVTKKYEQFESELPSLQSYISRYKRAHPELMRGSLMVQMLSIIPKVNYDAKRSAWRSRDLLTQMQVPPETLPLKITEMEVIPYEKMWQFVIEFLGTIRNRSPRQTTRS